MPADVDEIKALLAEGIELHELVAPEKLVLKETAYPLSVCAKNATGKIFKRFPPDSGEN